MEIKKYLKLSFYAGLYNKSIIGKYLKKTSLPGMGGVPVEGVIWFFYLRLKNEAITMRAASIAYRFFFALFPALIVFFSIIPYIPVQNMQVELLNLLKEFLPKAAYETIQFTVTDIVLKRRTALLSFSFILTVYFASLAIISLFNAFNTQKKMKLWKTYLISFALVFIIAFSLIFTILLQITGEYVIWYLKFVRFIPVTWITTLIWWFKFLTTLFLSLTTISILYYFGTVKPDRQNFYSPGAFLATLLILITSYGFGFYIENFGQYNMLYGSLGALIVLMMWIYLNAFGLIVGYEFNQGLIAARNKANHDKENHSD